MTDPVLPVGSSPMTDHPAAPKRIQRKRTKGWTMPEGAIYVGRPTKWGNPFYVMPRRVCPTCNTETSPGDSAEDVVRDYRHFLDYPENLHGHAMPTKEEIRTELRGHDLACWCALDQPCHGDVLLEIANDDIR